MKLNPKNRKWLLGGGLLLLTATPSFALFGIGDIVFDPTSYASLVSQLTTLQTQYTMLKNNIEHFSIKQQWQTTLTALKNANVKNMFGETNGMTTALNSNSPSASSAGWTAATVPVNSDLPSYYRQSDTGEPPDGAACHDRDVRFRLPGLHYCRGRVPGRTDTERDRQQHPRSQPARRLNRHEQRSPAAQSPQRSGSSEDVRDADPRASCRPALRRRWRSPTWSRRNAAATDLNTAVFVQTQHATHDMSAASEDNTWQTYLPYGVTMLKLLNTKLLIAILAVLAVIASAAIYQRHEAAKAAAILEQQQRDAEQRRKEDEAFRKKVEEDKKRHNSAAGNEGKTWKTYIP